VQVTKRSKMRQGVTIFDISTRRIALGESDQHTYLPTQKHNIIISMGESKTSAAAARE
jgi:hypothetical protein